MAVDKNSKAYQSLLKSWYTDEQINQMSSSVAWWQSAKDVVASTQPTNTTVTYGWKANVTPTNVVSQQSQNANYNNAKVGTWAVASMPEQPKTTTSGVNIDNIAKAWNNMDYSTQQDKLSKISWLKEALAKNWITIKEAPEQTTTQTAAQTTTTKTSTPTKTTTAAKATPQQDKWDYQDNSQARMDEIARNLNWYRQTNPWLFEDMSAFYNFFIKDKGRSQDQIDFLWGYFNRVQEFWKYDNLPASTIWDMLVNGKLWDDYLNYLKSTDPQKYQEALSYRQDWEDKIKDKTSLDTIDTISWKWEDTTTSNAIKWLKEQWLFVDKDWNLIDDRTENYATDEEKQYAKDAADIIARNLDIDNTVKHTYEDYVKAYPWATKATLMAMAQDVNADLLREKENNNVELTRLQWYMSYLQTEREDRTEIWQKAIEQLQKQYGMYYTYSPEWMSELLNAQYEATSPSLTSVENWTETEKRRALDTVLTDYYDKYSSIIQRPKSQVISDVIAYANDKWITLEQALQENFVTPLKAKPEYKSLSSNLEWSKYKFASYEWADWIKHTIRYNEETWDWEEIFWDEAEWYSSWLVWWVSDFINNLITWWYKIASNWWSWGSKIRSWWCWTVVNDYLEDLWESIRLTEANDIKPYATSKAPSEWAIAYFDWTQSRATPATKEHWHVWIVVWDNWDTITVLESNEWTWLRYNTYKKSDVTWYYQPSKKELWYWENPMTNMISLIRSKWNLTSDWKKDVDFASKAYQLMYELASDWDIDYLIKSPEWQKFISNLKSASFTQNDDNATWVQVFNALKNGIADQRNLKTVNKLINIIELKLRKTSWAAIAASEWNSNFDMLLPWVNETPDVALDKYRTFEKTYLVDYFNSAWNNIKWYKYIPLFEEGSPYYKVVSTTDDKDKKTTSWWTKINEVNWKPYTWWISVRYSTWDLINLWNEN